MPQSCSPLGELTTALRQAQPKLECGTKTKSPTMEHNTTAPAAYSTKSAPVRSSRTACGPKSHYGPLYSLSAALEIEFWRKFGNRSPGHFVDSFYILVVQVDDWFDCLRLRNFPPRQAYLYARVCVCHLAVFCQHMILRRRPVLLILRRRPVLSRQIRRAA